MEAERKQAEQIEDTFTYSEEESSTNSNRVPGPLAISGIFFQCPMIGKCFYFFHLLLLKRPFVENNS